MEVRKAISAGGRLVADSGFILASCSDQDRQRIVVDDSCALLARLFVVFLAFFDIFCILGLSFHL